MVWGGLERCDKAGLVDVFVSLKVFEKGSVTGLNVLLALVDVEALVYPCSVTKAGTKSNKE